MEDHTVESLHKKLACLEASFDSLKNVTEGKLAQFEKLLLQMKEQLEGTRNDSVPSKSKSLGHKATGVDSVSKEINSHSNAGFLLEDISIENTADNQNIGIKTVCLKPATTGKIIPFVIYLIFNSEKYANSLRHHDLIQIIAEVFLILKIACILVLEIYSRVRTKTFPSVFPR